MDDLSDLWREAARPMTTPREEHERLPILARSRARAPSCLYQLTVWVHARSEIEFAIRQLDRYDAPWMLKGQDDGPMALFVHGPRERDETGEARG